MSFPQYIGAAYLRINNAAKRNALSLAVLQDLKRQLIKANTSPVDGRPRFLPPFRPEILDKLEASTHQASPAQQRESISETEAETNVDFDLDAHPDPSDLTWLTDTTDFTRHREGLPRILILRTTGPVFSSGHDLKELSKLSYDDVKRTFALCANVMRLIRRSPVPVLSILSSDQLATAAGAQLYMTCDLALAHASSRLQLPGQSIGIPCTSPSSAISRRIGWAATYKMLALAEAVRADELFGTKEGASTGVGAGAVEVCHGESADMETRIESVVGKIVVTSAMQQAMGKWAFHTQYGINGGTGTGTGGGDGYEDAVAWTGRVMALHARMDDAKEGVASFFEKRSVSWRT